MKQTLVMLLFVVCGTTAVCAQQNDEIFGLRVFANNDEYLPPVITLNSESITIEFDVATPTAGNYQIIFQHASKDWTPDNNAFLNSPLRDRSQRLQYAASPGGVRTYTFHFRNSFPDPDGVVQFPYSGNYIFRIVNANDTKTTLAEGRFIAVERTLPVSFRIANKYYPGATNPDNQRLYAAVDVDADAVAQHGADDTRLMHQFIKSVYIFQNWLIDYPYRIDVDDKDPDTFVENFMLPKKRFWIRSIPAGNEYRRLDLSSVKFYPNGQPVRLVDGPDQSRMHWQGKNDANGAAKLRPFAGINSDYLDVEFRLKLASRPRQDVFLVGAMSEWEVRPENKLAYDAASGVYGLHTWVRRGVYDYQYVLGTATGDGTVVDLDWIALEGNDWRTISRYTAVVYYKDDRFGGFDRAIGMAVTKSPGGSDETSLDASPGAQKPKPIMTR